MRALAALALLAALSAVGALGVAAVGYHVNAALEGAQALSGPYPPLDHAEDAP